MSTDRQLIISRSYNDRSVCYVQQQHLVARLELVTMSHDNVNEPSSNPRLPSQAQGVPLPKRNGTELMSKPAA